MASSQSHTHETQKSAQQAARLLRPERDPDVDMAAAFDPQRVLGNRALGVTHAGGDGAPGSPGAPGDIVQRARLVVQPKLTLGPVNDTYEREADSVAQQVVQRLAVPSVQRHNDDETVQRQEEEEEEMAQGKRIGGAPGPVAIDPGVESQIQRARSGGAGLDDGVRAPMEESMGADFSGVRVHTGPDADQLNQSLSARAFTTGNDIFFRSGEYNPGSRQGQELLAHELTHVVQQGAATVRPKRLPTAQVQRKRAAEDLFFAGHE